MRRARGYWKVDCRRCRCGITTRHLTWALRFVWSHIHGGRS